MVIIWPRVLQLSLLCVQAFNCHHLVSIPADVVIGSTVLSRTGMTWTWTVPEFVNILKGENPWTPPPHTQDS
jgi:hypothetical protein